MKIPHLRIISELDPDSDSKYSRWTCSVNGDAYDGKDSVIFPVKKGIEVKQILRTDNNDAEVFLKGLSRRYITPGSIIVPIEYSVTITNTAFGICINAGDPVSEKDQEFTIESDSLPLLSSGEKYTVRARSRERCTSLSFSRGILLCPGERYRLIDGKGRSVVFIPMITRQVRKSEERNIQKRLAAMRENEISGSMIWLFRARVSGWTFVPPDDFLAVKENLPPSFAVLDTMIIHIPSFEIIERDVMAFIRKNPGKRIADISREKMIDRALVKEILNRNNPDHAIQNQGGLIYMSVESHGDEKDLSPAARNVLSILKSNGYRGISQGDRIFGSVRPVLQELIGKGYAVNLGKNCVLAMQTLRSCSDFLRNEIQPGQHISSRFLKERLSLSRGIIASLIDRLVYDGVVVRTENGLSLKDHTVNLPGDDV